MKKTIFAFIAGMLLIAGDFYGEAKSDELYKKMIQANSRPALSKNHKNWRIQVIPAGNKKKSEQVKAYGAYSYMSYNEADLMYFEHNTAGMNVPDVDVETGLYTRSGDYFCDYKTDGSEVFKLRWYTMSPEQKKLQAKVLDDFALLEDGQNYGEVFISSEDNGDGSITITTNAPASEAIDITHLPKKWKKLTVEYKYLLDAKSLECQRLDVSILTKKGKLDYIQEVIEYDINYSGNPNMEKLLNFEKRVLSENPENPRKATIIYNPGKPDEEIYTKVSDMSYLVFMYFKNGYSAFEDPELTIPFSGSKGRAEFTVYLSPEK